MRLDDLKFDKLKRFNIITGPGGIDSYHVKYDIENILIRTSNINIVKIDIIDILCKNTLIYKSPNLIRKIKSNGLLILDDALDVPTAEMRLDHQQDFFDDLFEKIRVLDAKVIITTENIDVIKNFCLSSTKTIHDDCAYFKLYEESDRWLVKEHSPKEVLYMIASGKEVR